MNKKIQVKELEVGDSIIGPDTGNELLITGTKQTVVFGWNAYNTEYGQLYLDPEAEIEIFWTNGPACQDAVEPSDEKQGDTLWHNRPA